MPGAPPTSHVAPEILGPRAVGESVRCERGAWSGSRPTNDSYIWARNGDAVSAATGATYRLGVYDTGRSLSAV